jgi:hypothetical protein
MRRALFAVSAIGLFAALAPSAFAATTVGQAAPSTAMPIDCSELTGVQTASGSGAPTYTIPASGVLTHYTTRAGSAAGTTMRLVVFRRSGSAFMVVGRSDANVLTPNAVDGFPAQINVLSGDLLGLQVTGANNWCVFAGVLGDQHSYGSGFDPQPGATFSPTQTVSGNRWNIEATLEPPATPVTPVKKKCKHKKKHKSAAQIAKKCKKKHH